MAEAAGLVLGVAGLTGLLNACIDAVSLSHAARSHDRDFEIRMTQLEIEKTLILLWAKRISIVGVLTDSSAHNHGLNDQRAYSAVARTLSCMFYLLTDAKRLHCDYGVAQQIRQPVRA